MKRKERGFTLVELMVVIVIIGILAAVAIPKFTMASHKAKASEFPTVLTSIYTAEHSYEAEEGSFGPVTAIDIDQGTLASIWFSYTVPTVGTTNFTARAQVIKAFGTAAATRTATIDQAGTKLAADGLSQYAKNWTN